MKTSINQKRGCSVGIYTLEMMMILVNKEMYFQ